MKTVALAVFTVALAGIATAQYAIYELTASPRASIKPRDGAASPFLRPR